jgi:hypothetical protein
MDKYTGLLPQRGRWADCYRDDYRVWLHDKPRPDYTRCFRDRIEMINQLRTNPQAKTIMDKYYSTNPVAFVLDWCITYDPRNAGTEIPTTMPFGMFLRQIDLVQFIYEALEKKAKGLLEKSRDYGATWVAAAMSVWIWKYRNGSSVGWGSRKEILVDKLGDPDSIFEKIRLIIRYLPDELKPRGFREKDHCTFMKCINPENGATITGEAGDNIGRGGRKSIYFLDEAAHVDRPELIEASLSANTNVRIDISSVNGIGNVFYRRRMAGVEWEPDKKIPKGKTWVLILDWRDHPGKDQEWYNIEKKSKEDDGLSHIFAQEVDRDYAASVQGVLIPAAWVRAAIDAHIKLGIEPTGKKVAGQDAADGGEDSSALVTMKGVLVNFLAQDNRGAEKAAPGMLGMANMMGVDEYWYESTGVGTGVKVAASLMPDLKMPVKPWVPNAKVVDPSGDIIAGSRPGDPDRRSNKDYFANYKAQSSWALRMRFHRTYKWVVENEPQDPDEIICIDSKLPFAQQLEAELSQPTYDNNGAGKIAINKKPNGSKSPNLFDALVICASPKPKAVDNEVLGMAGVSTVGTPQYGSVW